MAGNPGKLRVCNREVHDGTERVPCNTPYIGTTCPKSSIHIMLGKTGFCGNKFCEGTRPKSYRGTPQKTCEFWTTCPCDCHAQLDSMFKMVGEKRILMENPEYVPERVDFNILDYISPRDTVALGPDGIELPPGVERPAAASVRPPVGVLAERRTDTGRAARGGLEAQVWALIRKYAEIGAADLITPKFLADAIAVQYKIPTPSTGAIGSVFDRWEKLGYAKQQKGPVRFVGFTGDGTWEELEIIKAKRKRDRKMSLSAQKRGVR